MTEDTTCPIWETPATEHPANGRDGRYVDSPRAGGKYFVTGTAVSKLKAEDESTKARLTSWLIEQRNFGVKYPEIDSDTIKSAKMRRPLSIGERTNRLLRYLADCEAAPGAGFLHPVIENRNVSFLFCLALIESEILYIQSMIHVLNLKLQEREIQFYFSYLKKKGWIENIEESVPSGSIPQYRFTVEGYVRLAELEENRTSSSSAFVAMWFSEEMNEAWRKGIEPGIRDAGYKAVRVDHEPHNDRIDDRIIAEIRKSRFVVADFTQGRTGARGGVYYEAGFAHGLGIPVIFTCRQNKSKKVHFDTRQYNHIFWKEPIDLKQALTERIAATIGEGPIKVPD